MIRDAACAVVRHSDPMERRGESVCKPEQVETKEKSIGYKLQAWQVWPGMLTTKTGSRSTLSKVQAQRLIGQLDDVRFENRSPEVQGLIVMIDAPSRVIFFDRKIQ